MTRSDFEDRQDIALAVLDLDIVYILRLEPG